jgi:nitrogen regulatory protein PII
VWIVPEESVRAVVTAVMAANQSGAPGDGKVFVCSLDEVTDEEALAAGGTVGSLAVHA